MNRVLLLTIFVISCAFLVIFILFKQRESVPLSGGCDQTNSPYLEHSINEAHRISYCEGGDYDLKEIISGRFLAGDVIAFWYAGYPSRNGLGVSIVGTSGDSLELNLPDAGDKWVFYNVSIPDHLKGIEVTLVAKDKSSDKFGWLGISSPSNSLGALEKIASGLTKSATFGLLFYVVLASTLAYFLTRYVVDIAVPLFLVTFGLIGYGAFFLYLWKVSAGIGFSILYFVLIALFVARLVLNRNLSVLILSLKLVSPTFVLGMFVVLVGYFPFDSVAPDAWHTAADRWISLPIDNWISKMFADQIWAGHVKRPMVGDWISSDRGPLQTGIALIFYPLRPGDALLYQIVATMLQTLILLPAWLILRKLSVEKKPEIILALGLSSMVFLHSLYVWPKLISATYVALVYLFIDANTKRVSSFQFIMIVGASSALAMLSHGGALFPLVVLGVLYLFDMLHSAERQQKFNLGVTCVFVFILIMSPWLAYGMLIDPSHARLFKWHFAGHIPPSDTSALDVLRIAYYRITFTEWLQGRMANLATIFFGNFIYDVFRGSLDIKAKSFYAFNYSMWFFSFLFVIPVWFIARRTTLPTGVSRLLTVSIGSLMLWVLSMYVPGSTVIHQGSFFPWIGIFCISCIAFQSSSVFIFRTALFGNLMILFVCYVPMSRDASIGITIFYYVLAILMFGWFLASVRNMDAEGINYGL